MLGWMFRGLLFRSVFRRFGWLAIAAMIVMKLTGRNERERSRY